MLTLNFPKVRVEAGNSGYVNHCILVQNSIMSLFLSFSIYFKLSLYFIPPSLKSNPKDAFEISF